ncbi:hypothetical protein C8R47DRAFT_149614 [Mycena vitilis]|nr:hypothetical protein C8R47DRAFT_149614 [Mycena vitilis]
MSGLKRPAEDDAAPADTVDSPTGADTDTANYVAAPAPSHLFVILADEEYDAGLSSEHEGPRPLGVARTIAGATALLQSLHDAQEAKRVLKDGETREEFGGLDTGNKKGKLVGEAQIGEQEVRVEKWKVAEGKEPATGAEFVAADTTASAPSTHTHYAYTIVYSWSDHYGDTGAHTFGAVALAPSAVPSLTCAKLPSKGRAPMKFPGADAKDGVLVAEDRESKGKGKNHLGAARRWVVRDWDDVEEGKGKKGPARKRAKTST